MDWILHQTEKSIAIKKSLLNSFVKTRMNRYNFSKFVLKLKNLENSTIQSRYFSNLLCKIYFHELDESLLNCFVENRNFSFSRKNKKHWDYSPFFFHFKRLSQKKTEKCFIPKNDFFSYMRYEKKWIIGKKGKRNFLYFYRKKIQINLQLIFQQNFYLSNLKLQNLHSSKIDFLNYKIFRRAKKLKKANPDPIRSSLGQLRFEIPLKTLLKFYKQKGYLKNKRKKICPTSKTSLINLSDFEIIKHFRFLRKNIQYYYLRNRNFQIQNYILYLLRFSCAMTLGHKHRLPCRKVFKIYGKNLTLYLPNSFKKISFSPNKIWFSKKQKWCITLAPQLVLEK
jgi:hypothetical protein